MCAVCAHIRARRVCDSPGCADAQQHKHSAAAAAPGAEQVARKSTFATHREGGGEDGGGGGILHTAPARPVSWGTAGKEARKSHEDSWGSGIWYSTLKWSLKGFFLLKGSFSFATVLTWGFRLWLSVKHLEAIWLWMVLYKSNWIELKYRMGCLRKIIIRTIFSVHVGLFYHILHRIEQRIGLVSFWACDLTPWLWGINSSFDLIVLTNEWINLLPSLLAMNQAPAAEELRRMAFASMHSQVPRTEKAVTLPQKCVAEKTRLGAQKTRTCDTPLPVCRRQ